MTQRQLAEIAFRRLIEDILDMDMNGPVALSLLEYTNHEQDIRYVLSMSDEEIDDLKYTTIVKESDPFDVKDEDAKLSAKMTTPTVTTYELPRGHKRLIKVVVSFNQYRAQSGNQTMDDWSDVTSQEFNEFRIHTYNTYVTSPKPSRFDPPNVTSSPNASSSISNKLTKAEQFRKGIKRDPSNFKVLKDKRQFKSWHRHLMTTAATQDVKEVLDPKYMPSTQEEKDLFSEKQQYMYHVADTILKTDRGIVFVGEHEVDQDAQKVFQKTFDFYLKSRVADIESSDILTYITSAKFGVGTWKGNAVGFISHWQEQVRIYNKLVDDSEEIKDKLKHTLLKTAVSQVKELCAVQDTADQLRTNTGRIQTYTEYCSLLISAATTYDKMFKPQTFSNRNNVDNRRMYQHEIQPELNFVDNHESFE